MLELVEVARPHGEVGEHPGRDAPESRPRRARPGRRARCTPRATVEADALGRGPGVRAVEAGPGRRRVEPDERIHLADLPVARERDGRARLEQAAEPPRTIPALLADVLHPGAGDQVGRAVPRLHRGGHPEFAEPTEVVGVQALDVHDPVAPVAACRSPGPRCSIASSASRMPASPVACVWVWKPSRSSSPTRGSSSPPGVARTAALPRPVRIVLEHQRRVRLDHVVGVQLDRSEARSRGRAPARRRRRRGAARGTRHRPPPDGTARRSRASESTPSASARSKSGTSASGTCGSTTVVMPSDGRHPHARTSLRYRRSGEYIGMSRCSAARPGLGHRAGVEVGDPAGRLARHRVALRAAPGDLAAAGDAEHRAAPPGSATPSAGRTW